MKAKDLKAGMEVVTGTSIDKLCLGVGDETICGQAWSYELGVIVVDPSQHDKRTSRIGFGAERRNETVIQPATSHAMSGSGALVAVKQRDGTWIPDVLPLRNILGERSEVLKTLRARRERELDSAQQKAEAVQRTKDARARRDARLVALGLGSATKDHVRKADGSGWEFVDRITAIDSNGNVTTALLDKLIEMAEKARAAGLC